MGMFDFLQPQPQLSPYAQYQGGSAPSDAMAPMPTRQRALVNALAGGQPQQQPMTSPWQAVGAAVNGAADGYLERQAQDAKQQALAQALAQQNGVQGPIQPAEVIQDQNKLFSLPSFDVGSVFGNWGW
jgi:hypothetical protein